MEAGSLSDIDALAEVSMGGMNPHRIRAIAASLLLSACGGSSSSNPPNLTVSPSSFTVTAGGPAVDFTATLRNTTGTIAWSLTGPGTLGSGSGTSTTYFPPATVSSATSATVTATAGGLSSRATVTISPPPPITVAGTVIDERSRKVSGAAVTVGGRTVNSDGNGAFSITDVTPPYDVVAIAPGSTKTASVYKGLTRPDPAIVLFISGGPSLKGGQVTGNVTGGDALGAFLEHTVVAWGSREVATSISVDSNPYTLNIPWSTAANALDGSVHALQWTQGTDGLLVFKGYGVRSGVRVSDSETTNNVDVAMTAPIASSVAGTIVAPSGVQADRTSISIDWSDNASISLASKSGTTTSFDWVFPSGTGGTASVTVSGHAALGEFVLRRTGGIAAGTTNASIALPTPVSPLSPANAETGVGTSTDFSWTALSSTISILIVQGSSGTRTPSLAVFTAGSTARIPDLSAQGLGLPAMSSFQWHVVGVGPHPTLDSAAGPTSIIPSGTDLFQGLTPVRTFTTP